jgi:PAS domain S-box-containing protein
MDFIRYVGEALAQSRQHACCVTDLQANFRYVNQAFCDFYGYSAEELLGKDVGLLTDEKTAQKAKQQHLDYLKNDIEPSQDWEVVTKDGLIYTVISSFSKFEHEGEAYMLTVLTTLEPSELSIPEQHKHGFGSKPKIASRYVYKIGSGIQEWSEGMYEIFRWPQEKGPMPADQQVKLMKQEDQLILDDMLKKCLQTGETFDHTYTLSFPDGQLKYVRSIGELGRNENDADTLIGLMIDITSEVQIRQQMDRMNKLHKLAVNSGKIGIWELDFLTGVSNFNEMWYTMMGYRKEDIKFSIDFFMSLVHPDDLPKMNDVLEDIMKGEDIIEEVLRLRAKDGSYRWILDKGMVTQRDADGRPTKMSGTHVDITDLKEAEQSLIESEYRYRFLTESLPHILWTANEHGELNYCNQYGLDYLGAKRSDIASWNWTKYIHPEDLDQVVEEFSEAIRNKHPYIRLQRLQNADGEYRWFRVTAYPQKDSNGEVQSWVGLSTEVHDAIVASENLEKTNNRLRSLIDASPIAIYSIDPEGTVTDFWNPAAEILFGWEKDDVIGRFLPHVQGEHLEEFRILLQKIKDGNELYKQRIIRTDSSGKTLHIEITAGPVFDKNGKIEEILILTSDVSELEQKSIELEASLHEKETLLQEIHHRVKNNLAVVSGLLHLQAFSSEDEGHRSKLTVAQNRIQTIAMVHELLYRAKDFSKINLSDYYEQLVDLIAGNLNFPSEDLDKEVNIDVSYLNINQAIPLGLLLNELLTNSIKYAYRDNEGTKKLLISIEQDADYLTLIYEDNGPGFNPEEIKQKQTVGWELIRTLISQLNAESELHTDGRFYLKLRFKNALEGRGAYSNIVIK